MTNERVRWLGVLGAVVVCGCQCQGPRLLAVQDRPDSGPLTIAGGGSGGDVLIEGGQSGGGSAGGGPGAGGGAAVAVGGGPNAPTPSATACRARFELRRPEVHCRYDAVQPLGTPVVADVDHDGKPEILFTADVPNASNPFYLVALNGEDCSEQYRVEHDLGWWLVQPKPAVADVDGDGSVEVVVATNTVVALFDGATGALLDKKPAYELGVGEATIIDVDGKAPAEIVTMGELFTVIGRKLVRLATQNTDCWTNRTADCYSLSVADVDGLGQVRTIRGGTELDPTTGLETRMLWFDGGMSGGPVAVIDFDPSSAGPEYVVARVGGKTSESGNVETGEQRSLYQAESALLVQAGPLAPQPGRFLRVFDGELNLTERSPSLVFPNVTYVNRVGMEDLAAMDLDADGRPEVVASMPTRVAAYDLDCDASPLPSDCHSRGIRWSTAAVNRDGQWEQHSNGPTAFDLNCDGVAEVVHQDACALRFIDGRTGALLYAAEAQAQARATAPIIADVDGTGAAKVVAIRQPTGNPAACAAQVSSERRVGPALTPGLVVLKDPKNEWQQTLPYWTMQDFRATNVGFDLKVPPKPQASWKHHNTWRVNLPVRF